MTRVASVTVRSHALASAVASRTVRFTNGDAKLLQGSHYKVYDRTPMKWNFYVYMLRCSDQSLYVGVTNNIERRFIEHQNGRNKTCFTYKRRPVGLVFCEHYQYIGDAIAREKQVKGWSGEKKEALCRHVLAELPILARRKTLWTAVSKGRSSARRCYTRVLGPVMLRDALANARAPQHDKSSLCHGEEPLRASRTVITEGGCEVVA